MFKEDKKELIDVFPGKMTFFKINCANRRFPAKVKILAKAGAFEVYVSKTETVTKNDYDFTFCTNEYSLEYESSEYIKYLYFGIIAAEKLRMQFMISFTQTLERQKSTPKKQLTEPKTIERNRSKKCIYEFFRENMRQDEFLELKDLVGKII